MRTSFTLALFTAILAASSLGGCGGDGEATGGNGGGGGAGAAGGGTTTDTPTGTNSDTTGTTSGNTGSTTSAGDCTGTLNGTSCANCIESSCCGQMTACLADPECTTCFLDPQADVAMCAENNDAFSMLLVCADDSCTDSCTPFSCDAPTTAPSGGSCILLSPTIQCNPVSNGECDTNAGEVCAYNGDGFECFPPPADVALCEACGDSANLCAPGTGCLDSTCVRFCCEDGDCGTGLCIIGDFSPVFGYCATLPIAIPCDGDPNGVCDPAKESCQCADCKTTAYCVKDKCTTDGMCTVDDSCICPDCDAEPSCGCNYDFICQSFTEGCQCPDCWEKTECLDNPMDKCTDNGMCADTEYCVCVDCQSTGLCQDPNYCTDDGECVAYEGCHCNDCANEPSCP